MKRSLERPSLISTHPTVDSFAAAIKGIEDRGERVERIRQNFRRAGDNDTPESSAWTGQEDRMTRLKIVRTLLPLAQTAVESMIATLSEPSPKWRTAPRRT